MRPLSLHAFSPFFWPLHHGALGLFLSFCESLSKATRSEPSCYEKRRPGFGFFPLSHLFSTAESLR